MQLTHGTRPVAAWEHQNLAAVLRLWRGAKHHHGHSFHWCQLQAVTGTGFNPLQSSSPCWCWPWWHGERGACGWLICAPSWGLAMLSISGEGRHLVAPMVPQAPLGSVGWGSDAQAGHQALLQTETSGVTPRTQRSHRGESPESRCPQWASTHVRAYTTAGCLHRGGCFLF